MVKMINKITGTDMYVDESRVGEYIALGHRTAISDLEKKEPDAELKKAIKRVSKKKV